MTLVWAHFGRERHVLSWAMAYGCSTMHWALNAIGLVLLPGNTIVIAVATLFPVVTSSLVAIGCRQRARLPEYFGWFVLGGGCACIAIILAFASTSYIGMRGAIPAFYTAAMVMTAISALWRKPALRTKPKTEGLKTPEITLIALLAILVLYQIILGVTALIAVGPQGDPGGLTLLRVMLGIGLPPVYVAVGIAFLFLVTGDIADQLRRLVTRDPLTGILNRRGLDDAAVMAIANARRHDRDLSVALADIDGFKGLNDRFGHVAGDKALIAFTEYVQAAIRNGDVFGRLGGDEFCVILFDTNAIDAARVMERACADVERHARDETPEFGLTASFGVASLRPGDLFLDSLIRRADRALYQAKLAGRNRVVIARGEDEDALAERRLVEST
ncbi:GGDEF domain-containing protein [Rhizorhapis sp. SPR117]|uniref:GGDEF domain-containing protein n=1 Tax=Rhizorhapis sp. SPR117 TaxID=2912611 RepID=UPI001F3B5611|nr:GGDEF domain-containing protein [Rhizorhapis sp. SPR117]